MTMNTMAAIRFDTRYDGSDTTIMMTMNTTTVKRFDTKAKRHGDTINMMMIDTTVRGYDDSYTMVTMTKQYNGGDIMMTMIR
eukprot:CAMPEP_0172520508 /NCGR_PEP_ID=MMETSP1066-20121228/292048_1 /TAXON_ID=671091 /ORGANISM="Coscinodiscus wailesii, Strain CCMP2513" /LENGTH=81 /DNA_ID=CAMNT_0013303287 /DNA_START=154 /DNA_END=399 /DNA_ORIENTATION=-